MVQRTEIQCGHYLACRVRYGPSAQKRSLLCLLCFWHLTHCPTVAFPWLTLELLFNNSMILNTLPEPSKNLTFAFNTIMNGSKYFWVFCCVLWELSIPLLQCDSHSGFSFAFMHLLQSMNISRAAFTQTLGSRESAVLWQASGSLACTLTF